jgi:hypothetical protein
MIEPDIEPAPIALAGPTCGLCGDTAVVHWQRRLTGDEIAAAQQIERDRRDQVLLLADHDKPLPEFGPLPDCADYTRAVHGCLHHAITLDAASLVHQGSCTAPATSDLPGCDCTPEQPPQSDPGDEPAQLPEGW